MPKAIIAYIRHLRKVVAQKTNFRYILLIEIAIIYIAYLNPVYHIYIYIYVYTYRYIYVCMYVYVTTTYWEPAEWESPYWEPAVQPVTGKGKSKKNLYTYP